MRLRGAGKRCGAGLCEVHGGPEVYGGPKSPGPIGRRGTRALRDPRARPRWLGPVAAMDDLNAMETPSIHREQESHALKTSYTRLKTRGNTAVVSTAEPRSGHPECARVAGSGLSPRWTTAPLRRRSRLPELQSRRLQFPILHVLERSI